MSFLGGRGCCCPLPPAGGQVACGRVHANPPPRWVPHGPQAQSHRPPPSIHPYPLVFDSLHANRVSNMETENLIIEHETRLAGVTEVRVRHNRCLSPVLLVRV